MHHSYILQSFNNSIYYYAAVAASFPFGRKFDVPWEDVNAKSSIVPCCSLAPVVLICSSTRLSLHVYVSGWSELLEIC